MITLPGSSWGGFDEELAYNSAVGCQGRCRLPAHNPEVGWVVAAIVVAVVGDPGVVPRSCTLAVAVEVDGRSMTFFRTFPAVGVVAPVMSLLGPID